MENVLLTEEQSLNVHIKKNSQFFKTWFIDRHIEATLLFTDGTYYSYPVEYMQHSPHSGDPKHYEWIWRDNKWEQTFGINY